MAVDSIYYGRFVFAPWNILVYNVFSEGGSNLYGGGWKGTNVGLNEE